MRLSADKGTGLVGRRRALRVRHCALLAACGVVTFAAVPAVSHADSSSLRCPNEALRVGPSAALPDCRAYEQVSPVEKAGNEAVATKFPTSAAPDGEAVSYMGDGIFAGAAGGSTPNAYVSRRGASGWETTSVAPATPDPTPPGGDPVSYDFAPDLSQVVLKVPVEQLTEGATPNVTNLFMSATTGKGGYSWINSAQPKELLPEACPRPEHQIICWQFVDKVAFAGASADLSHVLFEADESLVEGAPEERHENLYESTYEAGKWHVSLVGILPDKADAAEGSTAGSGSSIEYFSVQTFVDKRVANAISEDGSRVVFQAKSDEGKLPAETGQAGQEEVYDRIGGSETIELSAPAVGAAPNLTTAEPAEFWAASADGSRVFFTSKAELTTHSYTGASEPMGQDLYEYNLGTKELKDLTVDTDMPADEEEGAAVQGVVGASSDGSYVYFVAKGQLVPGEGVDHEDNLYMVHDGGAPVYIATLNGSDGRDWTAVASFLESYVTPDGGHMAFTSVNSIPTVNFPDGYNNVNESTSVAEPEVYEYSAPSAGEEKEGLPGNTVCVSCDPSGAPPVGSGLLGGVNRDEVGSEFFSESSPFHQVRAVSDNGARVFFSSNDPLVAAAIGNTQAKVYEYEQEAEGSCETPGGCVYLLSSPSSPQAAAFLDADGEGNNAFFATISQLTRSDQDNLIDVYDARVGGGFSPVESPPPCTSGCRGKLVGPSQEAAPLSAATGTSGNLVSPPGSVLSTKTAIKRKTAAQVRAQKLARALHLCRGKQKPRRKRCEAEARKRYGAASKANATMSTWGRK
jgi:hypothetical protein